MSDKYADVVSGSCEENPQKKIAKLEGGIDATWQDGFRSFVRQHGRQKPEDGFIEYRHLSECQKDRLETLRSTLEQYIEECIDKDLFVVHGPQVQKNYNPYK